MARICQKCIGIFRSYSCESYACLYMGILNIHQCCLEVTNFQVGKTKCKSVPTKKCSDVPVYVPKKECKHFPKTVCLKDPVQVER